MKSQTESFLTTSSEDFFLNIAVFGLHNSRNLHAFERRLNYNIFNISTCIMCRKHIGVFTDYVCCLTCGCIAHRKCHNSDQFICKKLGIMFQRKSLILPVGKHEKSNEIIVIAHSSRRYTWEEISSTLRDEIAVTESAEERFAVDKFRLDKMTYRLLSDPATFPGRLQVLCTSLYMLLKFESPEDEVHFARKCLDTVAAALIFEIEKKYSISVPISHVVSFIDSNALSSFSSRMFNRVMSVIKRLPDVYEKDSKLMAICDKDVNCAVSSSSSCEAPMDYSRLIKFTAALDKCQCFLEILERAMRNLCFRDVHVTGDSGLQSTVTESVDTDALINEVAQIIRQSDRIVFWYAECTYVNYMCNEEQWLNGKEGYALTTVMQAVELLISHLRSS